MRIPPEITFRDVERTPYLEALVADKIAKLEETCDYITSCMVAIEQPNSGKNAANPHRVRVAVRVPPGHEIAAARESRRGKVADPLPALIRDAFDAARGQLNELVEKERREVKANAREEKMGLVDRLFTDAGYGFIRAWNGEEIYFHRNSVLNREFDRLRPGTGVRFHLEAGAKGPQASSVQLVDRPGPRA